MLPKPSDAPRVLTNRQLRAVLRQPHASYQPMRADPLQDATSPVEPGALAWLLAHRLPRDDLRRGMAVWIETAEGRIDNDAGLCQAWAQARCQSGPAETKKAAAATAPAQEPEPCFAAPKAKRLHRSRAHRPMPPPAPIPASTPEMALSPLEYMLTQLTMTLAEALMLNLGIGRPPADASQDEFGQLLRQGTAIGFVLDLPLGRHMPPDIRSQPRTAGYMPPEVLFGMPTATLMAEFQALVGILIETARDIGTTGTTSPEDFALGLQAFEQYSFECEDRIDLLGRQAMLAAD